MRRLNAVAPAGHPTDEKSATGLIRTQSQSQKAIGRARPPPNSRHRRSSSSAQSMTLLQSDSPSSLPSVGALLHLRHRRGSGNGQRQDSCASARARYILGIQVSPDVITQPVRPHGPNRRILRETPRETGTEAPMVRCGKAHLLCPCCGLLLSPCFSSSGGILCPACSPACRRQRCSHDFGGRGASRVEGWACASLLVSQALRGGLVAGVERRAPQTLETRMRRW